MIRIENLGKRFRKLWALDGVNAEFSSGEVISLVGPNGSGKTTLIKSILGLVRPSSGKIFVNDHLVDSDPSYRRDIGYMPQIGRYPDNMKVGQLFSMLKNIRDVPDADTDNDLISAFQLSSIYEKPMRTLSGGTRQKVSAALAFLFNPPVLILDEPTAGLDPLSSEILKEKIRVEKKKNKLVLISSHILSDLDEITSSIMYLQEGKMIFLKPLETLQQETGELRLGKAIAKIMHGENKDSQWISKILEETTVEKLKQ